MTADRFEAAEPVPSWAASPSIISIVALWEDRAAHDAAIADEGSHFNPSYRTFEATDTVAEHELLNVVGRIIVPL